MLKLIIGIVIATVVLFFWGFAYWVISPYPLMIWKQAKDEDTAVKSLREHFPENGVYIIPGGGADDPTKERRINEGPVAIVHMISVNGRPSMDPKIMVGGFLLNGVAIVLIAILLRWASPALPGYLGRVAFVSLIGLTVALLVDGGDIIWWQLDLKWKLYQAGYNIGFWIITGIILAMFVRPAAKQA
jgi:hypothetical protein